MRLWCFCRGYGQKALCTTGQNLGNETASNVKERLVHLWAFLQKDYGAIGTVLAAALSCFAAGAYTTVTKQELRDVNTRLMADK